MKPNEIITALGNMCTYLLAYIQSNEVLQWIEFILAILTSIILLLYRLWVWYKEAKKDGKITPEELKDGLNTLAKGAKDIKEISKKKGEKDESED